MAQPNVVPGVGSFEPVTFDFYRNLENLSLHLKTMELNSQIFYGVFAFMWLIFLWESYLAKRQHKIYKTCTEIPKALVGILDTATFNKARSYQLDNSNFDFYSRWCSQIESALILLLGGIPFLWKYSGTVLAKWGYGSDSEILQTLVFLMLSSIYSTIIDLPWSVYHTFVIEQKHGFNKQTPLFYVKDRVKKFIVTQLIMLPIVSALIYIIKVGGDYFFFYVWIFTIAVSLFLLTVYPDFIAPLFDKYTPLPEGDLKTRIEDLAASINYPLKKIFVVEGSKRSSHSNAYLYGFFKNKRIVLFDTLLEEFNPFSKTPEDNADETKSDGTEERRENVKATGCKTPEVVAVLAHELGHWKFSHVLKNFIITQANLLFCFIGFSFLYKSAVLYQAFDFYDSKPTFIGLLIIFQFIFSPYNTLLSFIATAMTRYFEFQADNFAKTLGKEYYLRSALIKLNRDNLGFPIYDRLYSMWHHSHPPLLERLEALKTKTH
ncbi:CAAX prenyl protease 1 [Chamberlinius hualienensis]